MKPYVKKKPEPPKCLYNEGVICADKDKCDRCGWCPEVEQRRNPNSTKQGEKEGVGA